MNLQMFKEAEEGQQRFLQSLIESKRKADAEEREKEQEFFLKLKKSLLKTVIKLNFFVSWNFHIYKLFCF